MPLLGILRAQERGRERRGRTCEKEGTKGEREGIFLAGSQDEQAQTAGREMQQQRPEREERGVGTGFKGLGRRRRERERE